MSETLLNLIIDNAVLLTSMAIIAMVVGPYMLLQKRHSAKVKAHQKEAREAGLNEPVTIHPHVNRGICIGSGACIRACPEKEILGRIEGKAEAVYASRCVGHGACARACPVGAVELVFGSERRGVDLPQVFPNFETNVRQLFIAGELGGMGLIRNAILQGKEAVQYIKEDYREKKYKPEPGMLDLVIVGAGPSGMAATLQAMEEKLNFETLDQEESFGGSILSYPRGKLVMTRPAEIPIYGKLKKKEYSKEDLMLLWNDVAQKTGLKVTTKEKVESATKNESEGYFEIKTSKRDIKARYLLLCIGRRGTPRKLGVKGERQPHVMYRLLEPEKYKGEKILVVGGGDSAVEAAMSLGKQEGTKVALSYRKNSFSRIKPDNQARLDKAVSAGQVKLLLESKVKEIKKDSAVLDIKGQEKEINLDAVFVMAGGELPNDFLRNCGITIETKYGTR